MYDMYGAGFHNLILVICMQIFTEQDIYYVLILSTSTCL